MPTTYAHDLFGKQVYSKLPQDIRSVIRSNLNLYRIGLHGPDILFYNIPNSNVTGIGVTMHSEKAGYFFERGMTIVRENNDEKLLAYMIGFACHYLLDSKCHPFVYQMADKKVITHTILEKEFDRTLMIETNKDPHHYYPSRNIVPRVSYAKVIHRAIPKVKTKEILEALRLMKLITNCLVYDNNGRRRKFLTVLSRAAGKKLSDEMMEFFMTKDPVPGSEIPVRKLHYLYDDALEEAPQYIEELFELAKEDKRLSDRWYLTYNG